MRLLAGVGFVVVATGVAYAAPVNFQLPPETATLAPGPNHDLAAGTCTACHSADYITTQPRDMVDPRVFWTGEVSKMQHVYGAPIDDQDAKEIVNYLVATYGK